MTTEEERLGAEIPFWIFGQQKWVSGIGRTTTCAEVSIDHGLINYKDQQSKMASSNKKLTCKGTL